MKHLILGFVILTRFAWADGESRAFDRQLTIAENLILPLSEAMPAAKFFFAPTEGQFAGERPFALQISHVAASLFASSARILGEKNPSELGPQGNGPASLRTRGEILKYLKEAFAYGHRAMRTMEEKKTTEERISSAIGAIAHVHDHYGQMVIFARMNFVVPPASRGQ